MPRDLGTGKRGVDKLCRSDTQNRWSGERGAGGGGSGGLPPADRLCTYVYTSFVCMPRKSTQGPIVIVIVVQQHADESLLVGRGRRP